MLLATCRVMDRVDGDVQILLTITVVHGLVEALVLGKGNVKRVSIIFF